MATRKFVLAAAALLALAGTPPAAAQAGGAASAQRVTPVAQSAGPAGWAATDEVCYHIFVRSFRDSDGDGIGDLRGILAALPYLQELGVTSLLLSPIQPSPFYHNYFASSFEGVEPAYGTLADWRDLLAAVHERGLRVYLDVEIQYLAEGHPWWVQSAGRPGSPFSNFLLYHGPDNTRPESAVYGLTTTPTWDGRSIGLTTVNLREPQVRRYFEQLLADFADPNRDGRFEDGVDGFRIDHMMDDLDAKGIFTNLFADFWAPLFATLRHTNPALRLIAEQADWGYGEDWLARSGADLVFAFPLRGAIASLDRARVTEALERMLQITAAGKGQLVFIENHDVTRFASEVASDARKLRLGAALATLLPGTPSIYYGQELGMRGRHHDGWTADGSDIPQREAFEWTTEVAGEGTALWYRDTGPWWTERFARDADGISVAEQRADTTSLLASYRRLLAVRRARPELRRGDLRILDAADSAVLALARRTAGHESLLLLNFSDRTVSVRVPALPAFTGRALRDLLGGELLAPAVPVTLPPYGVRLLALPEPGP